VTGESKLTWIHCPTGPVQLPDSHMVFGFPSTAEKGCRPVPHWPGMAPMSDADEDPVTSVIPMYFATLWYLSQSGSV
jgi:hypothetical protein